MSVEFQHMSFSPGNITALIVAASFAAGLNIYATVLTLGILARTQWVALPPGLDSLGHTWILVTCGIMFALEFVADKIPAFDMVWNVLHRSPSRRWSPTTPVRNSRRRCRCWVRSSGPGSLSQPTPRRQLYALPLHQVRSPSLTLPSVQPRMRQRSA